MWAANALQKNDGWFRFEQDNELGRYDSRRKNKMRTSHVHLAHKFQRHASLLAKSQKSPSLEILLEDRKPVVCVRRGDKAHESPVESHLVMHQRIYWCNRTCNNNTLPRFYIFC